MASRDRNVVCGCRSGSAPGNATATVGRGRPNREGITGPTGRIWSPIRPGTKGNYGLILTAMAAEVRLREDRSARTPAGRHRQFVGLVGDLGVMNLVGTAPVNWNRAGNGSGQRGERSSSS